MVPNIRTFVNPQNRNNVGLVMDVADLDAVMATLASPEGQGAAEYDGVVIDTIAFFIQE